MFETVSEINEPIRYILQALFETVYPAFEINTPEQSFLPKKTYVQFKDHSRFCGSLSCS